MLARTVAVVLLTMLCASHSPSLASRALTLDECLTLGLQSNPTLKSSKLMVDWSEQGIKEARSDFLPSLSATSSFSRINNVASGGTNVDTDYINQDKYVYGVRLSQILYAGSRIYNSYSKAMVQKDVQLAEKEFKEADLILKIQTAFFKLMKAKEDVIVASETLKRLQSSLESATAFYERRMAPYVEVLQAKVDLADMQDQLSQVQNNVNRSRAELFQLMNIPFSEEITFAGGLEYYRPGRATTPEDCWKSAISNRSDLQSMQKKIEMIEKDIKIAKGRYLPTVRMDLGYNDVDTDYEDLTASGVDRDQRNKYWNVGVSATWDIFDGGRAWYQKEKYLLQKMSLKEDIKALENDINAQIRTHILTLKEAESRVASSSEAIAAAREYYEGEQKRFQAGIATVTSLLDAQARLTRADANLNQAQLDYQLARAELNFIIGKKIDKDLP